MDRHNLSPRCQTPLDLQAYLACSAKPGESAKNTRVDADTSIGGDYAESSTCGRDDDDAPTGGGRDAESSVVERCYEADNLMRLSKDLTSRLFGRESRPILVRVEVSQD